jgi:hypothetical protein
MENSGVKFGHQEGSLKSVKRGVSKKGNDWIQVSLTADGVVQLIETLTEYASNPNGVKLFTVLFKGTNQHTGIEFDTGTMFVDKINDSPMAAARGPRTFAAKKAVETPEQRTARVAAAKEALNKQV